MRGVGGNFGFLRSKATFSDSSLSNLHYRKDKSRQGGVAAMDVRERQEKHRDETEQNDDDCFHHEIKIGNALRSVAK